MSSYHTERAFRHRQEQRRQNPWSVEKPSVFWHVACLNNWQDVATEQLRLLSHVGLPEATACVLGTLQDSLWLQVRATELGVALRVPFVCEDLQEYEHPTLIRAYDFARANGGCVLYFHTKGVSAPDDKNKIHWRRLMAFHVIADWRENVRRLAVNDAVGIDWQDNRDFPHFSGNFWMARCDWLANLKNPRTWRYANPNVWIAGQRWERMSAEMWLGCEPWHQIESLCCRNENLWSGASVFRFPYDIDGFTY